MWRRISKLEYSSNGNQQHPSFWNPNCVISVYWLTFFFITCAMQRFLSRQINMLEETGFMLIIHSNFEKLKVLYQQGLQVTQLRFLLFKVWTDCWEYLCFWTYTFNIWQKCFKRENIPTTGKVVGITSISFYMRICRQQKMFQTTLVEYSLQWVGDLKK